VSLNPISKVRTSSKRLREKDVLTPEEFRALLEQLSVKDRAMVLLIGSTGVRRSELMALVWTDVDMLRWKSASLDPAFAIDLAIPRQNVPAVRSRCTR
jgi:integrase